MRALFSILFWITCELALANCVDDVVDGGTRREPLPTITLSATLAEPSDLAWENSLVLFEALNLVPAHLTLSYRTSTLKLGHYPTRAAFQKALTRVSKSPEGNLVLRLVAHICLTIAQEQKIDHAGDLFLQWLNQPPVDADVLRDGIPLEQFSALAPVLVKQFSTTTIPPLPTLEKLDGPGILATAFVGINTVSAHFSGQYQIEPILISNVTAALRQLGFSRMSLEPLVKGSKRFMTYQAHGRHTLEWEIDSNFQPRPLLILPGLQNNFADLGVTWASIAKFDQQEVAGAVAMSHELGGRLNAILNLWEKLLRPVIIRAGGYRLTHAAQTATQGHAQGPNLSESDWSNDNLFKGKGALSGRSTEQNLRAAIAQILFSTIRALPPQNRALPVLMTAIRLLNNLGGRGITFRDLELACREYEVPIEFIASPIEREGAQKVWLLPAEGSASWTERPNYAAWVVVDSPPETRRLKTLWGISDEENLRRLGEDTGILASGG